MGTMPPPLQSGNMLQGSGSRVTDPSATPSVARQGGLEDSGHQDEQPAAQSWYCTVGRALLAGHLNYFKTGTDAAWKSRPAADNWNLSIYALLSLSSPFGYLRKWIIIPSVHASSSSCCCPETFQVVPSSILPKSLHLPRTQTSIFMPTFIQPHKQLIPHLNLIVSRRNDKLLVNLTCSM